MGFDARDALAAQKRMMLPRGLTLLGEESWELSLRWNAAAAEGMEEVGGAEGGGGGGGSEKEKVEFTDELMMLLRLCACQGEDFLKMPLLFQNTAISVANESKALDLLIQAVTQALKWTESPVAPAVAGGGGVTGGGGVRSNVVLLQRSDKVLLQAVIEQAEYLKTQPLPEPGARAAGQGFDDDEAW